MTEQRQPTAAEQINSFNQQLTEARGQAYEARIALDAAEDRIKAIKNALQGATVGRQFALDQAKEAEQKEAAPEGDAE